MDAQFLAKHEVLGELAITGELRDVDEALPAAIVAARDRRILIVASANSEEAALAQPARRCPGPLTLPKVWQRP
ncbi:hypothetical protein [Stenotrophomonas bentonitica]|uniref:hypothetical protein n=1 Tax=Stenotrophomonas bentonitica TaxID=1450134 RepID=UPI003BACA23A